jgi:protease-4
LSGLDKFSDSERQAMQKLMADIYDQFTAKAAEGRKMPQADLEKLARGRVYTGQQALKLKLVDQLGTLDDAVAHAKQLAGLKPEEKVERMLLPKAANPFESMFGPIDLDEARAPMHSATEETLSAALRRLSPEMAKDVGAVSILKLLQEEHRLTVLPFRIDVE